MLAHQPPAWYAIRTLPQHERTTAAVLEIRSIRHFLPTYRARSRWSDRTKHLERPLFPGYLFVHIDYARRLEVLNISSVRNIVSSGRQELAIPEEEIENIRRLVRSDYPLAPWPVLSPGQMVRIRRGPLEGLQGQLVRVKNVWRMIVSVPLLQRAIATEIDIDCLAAVGSGAV